ncbi:unnamed protein product [Angiostrongylus costaricensis]|uniref:DUF630 family protein n=1 Tax=Angiostrongylus costaricensis TaxID=334426 RepID=A0A0R3PN24_ANGCS|nr:unnamed protein product [Angiostrongylus costaricensis]
MVRWAQLLSNVSSRAPVPAPSTIDHVKEVVEISMYHVSYFVSTISKVRSIYKIAVKLWEGHIIKSWHNHESVKSFEELIASLRNDIS